MSGMCQCCQGPAQAHLCARCQRDLRAQLSELGWWIDRLQETALGQARLGDRDCRPAYGVDRPLPYKPRASEVHREISSILAGWVQELS